MVSEAQQQYFLSTLKQLIEVPSPSGYTDRARDFLLRQIREIVPEMEPVVYRNNGIELQAGDGPGPRRGLCSHYDTLGLYIASLGKDGLVRPGKVGGFPWSAVEGEHVSLFTRDGREYTGTVLYDKASTHIYGSSYEKDPRTNEAMQVRIDESVKSLEDLKKLGLEPGCFMGLEPGFRVTNGGFIKSRHLDNKAGCALLLTLLKELADTGKIHSLGPLRIIFTAGEEIGRGALFVKDLDELLIVDNAVVGDTQNSREDAVTICVRDSTGPFDEKMIQTLKALALEQKIDHELDIFKSYGSDAELVTRRGENTSTCLIGPGIHASHSFERTHLKSFEETYRLLRAWANFRSA